MPAGSVRFAIERRTSIRIGWIQIFTVLFHAIYCCGCLQVSRSAPSAKFRRTRSKFMIYKVGYTWHIFRRSKTACSISSIITRIIKLEKNISTITLLLSLLARLVLNWSLNAAAWCSISDSGYSGNYNRVLTSRIGRNFPADLLIHIQSAKFLFFFFIKDDFLRKSSVQNWHKRRNKKEF